MRRCGWRLLPLRSRSYATLDLNESANLLLKGRNPSCYEIERNR